MIRRAVWGLLGLLLLGVLVLGVQAVIVALALRSAATDLRAVMPSLADSRLEAAERSLESADSAAGRADLNTRGPHWWLAGKLPFIGDDVTAVRTVAEQAHALTGDVLTPLLALGDTVSPAALRPRNGRIDLDPLIEAAPVLDRAATRIASVDQRVGGIEAQDLIVQLRTPVMSLQADLQRVSALTQRASLAMDLMPGMLGADDKRSYLLVTQNNAEMRASGGTAGALALVTANRGRIELVAQRSATGDDWGFFDEPVVRLSADERALFGEGIATSALTTTSTPDFTRTAQILRRMWERREGLAVDGVVSVDPVTLSYVMRSTGSVRLVDGSTIDSTSVVPFLLEEVYREEDPQVQDALFASAARSIFDTLVGGAGGDARGALEGVALGARERRVLVWSSRADEEAKLADTVLGGAFFGQSPVSVPRVGVFLNDSGNDKMTYYLRHQVTIKPRRCRPDGSQLLDVRLRLRNVGPPGGEGLPPYVVGGNAALGIAPGALRLTTLVYAPKDGQVLAGSVDGAARELVRYPHQGHDVSVLTIDVDAEATTDLRYLLRTAPGARGDVDAWVTPGIASSGVERVWPSACSEQEVRQVKISR